MCCIVRRKKEAIAVCGKWRDEWGLRRRWSIGWERFWEIC